MRDRLRGVEVLENFGIPRAEAEECSEQSEFLALFRQLLFSRIVPCVKDIGLWGKRLQKAYVDMGVFEMGNANLDLLMAEDEEIAEKLDAERFAAEERSGWRRWRTRSRPARRLPHRPSGVTARQPLRAPPPSPPGRSAPRCRPR